MKSIIARIAAELSVRPHQVESAVNLLDEGATVPFIARYRKEATEGLDDTQLRMLDERLGYLRELEDRRATILKSIEDQGKLSDELKASILGADTKTALEDLYLPYKPKRRTKGQIAREAGIEPLAQALYADPTLSPEAEAEKYLNAEAGFADIKSVLDGARHILMEQWAEDAVLLGRLRDYLNENAVVKSSVVEGKEKEGAKFSDYFNYSEAFGKVPSHRALALFRGRNEGMLAINLLSDAAMLEDPQAVSRCEGIIAAHVGVKDQGRAADKWLATAVAWTWRIKLALHLETELFGTLREAAEEEAIKVFGMNLKDLLMAAPAGARATLGLDPGLRTGVKVAVTADTGKLLATTTIFPHVPQNAWEQSLTKLAALCKEYNVSLIAIGNGTASRETDKLAGELIKRVPELKMDKVVVSEAGASVYSASEFAAKEFPELDVSLRGAVSIARRLQDPLAELVKIEPKAIGVGQYQHDVSQSRLAKTLDAVVEDCVNAVGVDVNSASIPLLTRVSGLNKTLATNIVEYRDAHGRFKSRADLKAVPRLGEKTYELAAGFLRIVDGDNPLDKSAVHPEAYPVVERIVARTGKPVAELVGNSSLLKTLNAADFTDDKFGLPTVQDIIRELDKPGRDPRPEFKTATFKEGVEDLKDLKVGMVLEGVITNVTAFGAFVDIGVHQDGLVHISALSEKFVKDPREVVKAGDVVKVIEVELDRKRIALTMRLSDAASPAKKGEARPAGGRPQASARPAQAAKPKAVEPANPVFGNALAAAFAKAKKD